MECLLTKKYEKADSFLKRVLSQSRYASVRLIEPCVAVSNVYNKQFKFAVLADEWLYVTENPPKVAKDIQEVTRIVDITSVELINDVPEFLGGDLKYRTHHILVTYKQSSEPLDSTHAPTNLSPLSKSLQKNDLRKSRSVDENDNVSERISPLAERARKESGKLSRSLQENDLKSTRKKSVSSRKIEQSLSRSFQGDDLRRKLSSNQLDDSSLCQEKVRKPHKSMSPILPSRRKGIRKQSETSLDEDDLYENDSSLANSDTLGAIQRQQARLLQLPTSKSLEEKTRRRSSPSTFNEDKYLSRSWDFNRSNIVDLSKSDSNKLSPTTRISNKDSRRKSSPPLLKFNSFESDDGNSDQNSLPLYHSFSTVDDFKSKNNPTRLTVSASAADLRAMHVKFDATLNSGSTPNLTSTPKSGIMGNINGLQSWFKERRGAKPGGKSSRESGTEHPSGDLENGPAPEAPSEIHLYMILDDTVMLAYLRSIWDNCLLNSAVRYAKREKSPKPVVKNKSNSSQVTALFDQMEKEILNSEDFQATFELIHELFTACQKDVLVKKLFWQSPDLFVFLVKKINRYIKENSSEQIRTNKADKLEFVLLLIECLTEMFRETELLSSRMNRLKTRKYSIVHDLIISCITCPELNKTASVIESPDISEAAEILLTGMHRKKKDKTRKSLHDIELENLSSELIKHQVGLLHELFIIAYQAVWFPSDDKTLNVSWMVKVVESSTTVQRFLQMFIHQVMVVIKKAEETLLSSDDTTLLYRLLSVLKILLQQSLKLRRHLHDFYTEEFRYYVRPNTISSSLSQECPLTPSTLKLIDDVIHLVTDMPSKNRR